MLVEFETKYANVPLDVRYSVDEAHNIDIYDVYVSGTEIEVSVEDMTGLLEDLEEQAVKDYDNNHRVLTAQERRFLPY